VLEPKAQKKGKGSKKSMHERSCAVSYGIY